MHVFKKIAALAALSALHCAAFAVDSIGGTIERGTLSGHPVVLLTLDYPHMAPRASGGGDIYRTVQLFGISRPRYGAHVRVTCYDGLQVNDGRWSTFGRYYCYVSNERVTPIPKRLLAERAEQAKRAAESRRRGHYCAVASTIYYEAANARNMGGTPQRVLSDPLVAGYIRAGFPEASAKAIINQVFFDPEIAYVSPGAIQSQALFECLHPQPAPSPLR